MNDSRGLPVHGGKTAHGGALNFPVRKSEEQWRSELSELEFSVLRQAGTERPGTGLLLNEHRQGTYFCRACGAKLFRSEKKFESFCGWPSFFDPHQKDAVVYIRDDSHGMVRTEVCCARCGSHLGHVFPDAPHTPTGMRYCMNSVSLTFTPDGETNVAAGVAQPEREKAE